MDHVFGLIPIKFLFNYLTLQRISPMFSSRSLATLTFTINTVIYLELIVVYVASYKSELLFLQMVT